MQLLERLEEGTYLRLLNDVVDLIYERANLKPTKYDICKIVRVDSGCAFGKKSQVLKGQKSGLIHYISPTLLFSCF